MSNNLPLQSNNQSGIAFINTFYTTGYEDQENLLHLLIRVTEEVMRHQPGFVSATLHQSLDGKVVTNVARWRSTADFNQALEAPDMRAHRDILGSGYHREGSLCQIVYTCTI